MVIGILECEVLVRLFGGCSDTLSVDDNEGEDAVRFRSDPDAGRGTFTFPVRESM